MNKAMKYVTFFVIISLFLTGCSTWSDNNSPKRSTEASDNVSICFINAGKCDSILVKAFGKNYLIDTGTKDSVDSITAALNANGVSSLDAVFLTHTHKDHIGGLKKLSKAYHIPLVYSASISMNEDDGTNKIDNLVDNTLSLNHEKLNSGDKINITDDVYFEVLGPLTYNGDDDNDNSLVLRLKVYGKTIIFSGDMQFAEEKTLMDAGLDLKADILKVGNHGNKDATSKEFAEAVSPEIAVITTNTTENSGTASKRVRKLFADTNLYITDEYDIGLLVIISSDGTISTSSQ